MLHPVQLQGALNLASDPSDRSILRPVRTPSIFSKAQGRVLCRANHSGGSSLVLCDGHTVNLVNASSGSIELSLDIGTDIYCASAIGGEITLLTADGSYLISRDADGGWTDLGYMPQFPAISISCESTGDFRATVTAAPLSGPYIHGEGMLNADDRSRLTNDVKMCYGELINDAASQGRMVQPALMRYRLLDAMGQVLYESSPVLVSAPGGFQMTETVSVDVNADRSQRNGHTFNVKGWRAGLTLTSLPEGPWAARVAMLEVLATPQIHPIRYDMDCTGRISSAAKLTFNLPGAAASPGGEETRRSLVRGTIERYPRLMQVVASIPQPFSGAFTPGVTHPLDIIVDNDARKQASAQSKALSAPAASSSPTPSDNLMAPHRFTATAVARSGAVIMYANPKVLPFPGHPLQQMTSSFTTQGGWRADVVVQLGDGSRQAVWSGRGDTMAPLLLNPVLTYPSADAVSMAIYYASPNGHSYRQEVPLTTIHGMNMSYYLHPSLLPWSVATIIPGWTSPGSNADGIDYEGYVAAVACDHPHTVKSMLRIAPSHIHDITPASRTSSAFNFGQGHFYAASAEGILSVTTSSRTILGSASYIDRRSVKSAGRLTVGPDCGYALVSGSLLRLTGNRSQVILSQISANALGWTSANGGELWLLDLNGDAMVYHPMQKCVSRRSCSGDSLWSDGDTLIISSDSGQRCVAHSDIERWSDKLIHVEMYTRPQLCDGSLLVDMAEVPVTGTTVNATIDIFGADHRLTPASILLPSPSRLLRFTVSGRSPHHPRVIFRRPRRQYIHLKISADVSADTLIEQ